MTTKRNYVHIVHEYWYTAHEFAGTTRKIVGTACIWLVNIWGICLNFDDMQCETDAKPAVGECVREQAGL